MSVGKHLPVSKQWASRSSHNLPGHSSALRGDKGKRSPSSHRSQILAPRRCAAGLLRPEELELPSTWVKLLPCQPVECAGDSDGPTSIRQGWALPCSSTGQTEGAHPPKRMLGCISPSYKIINLKLCRKDMGSQMACAAHDPSAHCFTGCF